jgi:hypothetical protein
MRRQHIQIGNEEALEGAAKTRFHKRSTQPKHRRAESRAGRKSGKSALRKNS